MGGVFAGGPAVNQAEVTLESGATLKTVLKKADAALGLKRPRIFKTALKQRLPLVLLLNGDRVDLPEDLERVLRDGDGVTALMPLSGG